MSIRKHLTCERGTLRRMNDFDRPVSLVQECIETGNARLGISDSNQEYALTAKIGITFWANDAQYRDARRIAERALLGVMYGEMFAKIAELRLAISDGDSRRAFAIADDMQKIIEAEG